MSLRLVGPDDAEGVTGPEGEDTETGPMAVDDLDGLFAPDDSDVRSAILLGKLELRAAVFDAIAPRPPARSEDPGRRTVGRRVITVIRRGWTQARLAFAMTLARCAHRAVLRRQAAVSAQLDMIVSAVRSELVAESRVAPVDAAAGVRARAAAPVIARPWFGGLAYATTGADLFILTGFTVFLVGSRPLSVLGAVVLGLGLAVISAVLARHVGLMLRDEGSGAARPIGDGSRGERIGDGPRRVVVRVRRLIRVLPPVTGGAVAFVMALRAVVAVWMVSATWLEPTASRLTLMATALGAAAVVLLPLAQLVATSVGSVRPGIGTVLWLNAILEPVGRRRFLRAERRLQRRISAANAVLGRIGGGGYDVRLTARLLSAERLLAEMDDTPTGPPWAADRTGIGAPRRLVAVTDTGRPSAAVLERVIRPDAGKVTATVAAAVMLGSLLSGAAVTASYARDARTSAVGEVQRAYSASVSSAPARPVVVLVSATRNAPRPGLTEADRAELEQVGAVGDGPAEIRLPDGELVASVPLAARQTSGDTLGRRAQVRTNVDRLGWLLDDLPLPAVLPDLLTALDSATTGRPGGTLLIACAGRAACAPSSAVDDPGDGRAVVTLLRDSGRLPQLHGWSVRLSLTAGAGRAAGTAEATDSVAYWDTVLGAAGAGSVQVDLSSAVAPTPYRTAAMTASQAPTMPAGLPLTREYLAARFRLDDLGFLGESVTVSPEGAHLLRTTGESIATRSSSERGTRFVAVRAAVSPVGPRGPDPDARLTQVRADAVVRELVTSGLPDSRVVVASPLAPDTGAEQSVEIWELVAA